MWRCLFYLFLLTSTHPFDLTCFCFGALTCTVWHEHFSNVSGKTVLSTNSLKPNTLMTVTVFILFTQYAFPETLWAAAFEIDYGFSVGRLLYGGWICSRIDSIVLQLSRAKATKVPPPGQKNQTTWWWVFVGKHFLLGDMKLPFSPAEPSRLHRLIQRVGLWIPTS